MNSGMTTIESDGNAANLREVRYRHSPSFVEVLRGLGCSLAVSTYQAGKLATIGVVENKLHFSFHNFDQAMGVAVSASHMAVGAKGQIWFLDNNRSIASSLAPAGAFDDCYLARRAHVTGGIHCHEMAWSDGGDLWVVNTLFSCLSTLHGEYSFVPRWRPPFITALAGEDRCHLNGLAMDGGRPRFVTVMSETDQPGGWRQAKETTGCVLDVGSGAAVTRGLAMPHSPRWHRDRLWVLNSGFGSLEAVDLASGRRDTVVTMPGYTRGLAFCGSFAFIGLSRIRESAVFGGVPIADHRDQLKCGVGVVDLQTGQPVASLEFETGVEEIFDVQVLFNSRCTAICGPRPDQDDAQDIWIVPRPDQVERIVAAGRGPATAPSSDASPRTSAAEGVQQWVEQALELQRQRRMPEALELFERAAAARPRSAEILNHLGNALQDAGRQDLALVYYQRAVDADPRFGPALQNLGYVLVAQGRTDEGVDRLKDAQRAQPSDVNHVLIATALPVIYESVADLNQRRAHLVNGVQRLASEGVTIDTADTLVPTNFFSAYQGENDRDLHANLGRIYRGVDLLNGRRANASGGRLRVGFLSAYFRDHTIGRLNLGRLEHLPRAQFKSIVLSVGDHQDDIARAFAAAADRYVVVPRQVAAARRTIAEQELDLLFFTDVGMDALSYTLAFSRMAPVQCTTWGHPVTTGSPTMDYFLSSELLEHPEACSHYSERLVRPASLATYYHRPKITEPPRSRKFFGLSDDAHVYVCLQTLYKLHPEFDRVLAAILRRDAQGQLVLIEGRTANWTRLLKARFEREMPDVSRRIHWLPALPNQDFLQLMALADVSLDPLYFGGGNTSYEALAMGTPVVTLPGKYLRSRITRALYARMGLFKAAQGQSSAAALSMVASSLEAYVASAIALSDDSASRVECRQWIASNSSCLFENSSDATDFGQCLTSMAHAADRPGPHLLARR